MKTLGKGGLPDLSQALRYVWNHDVDTAIVGMKRVSEVEENVAAANSLQPLTEKEKEELQKIAEEIIKANHLSATGSVTPY